MADLLLLSCASVFQDFVSVIILYLGLIAQRFIISRLEQLLTTIAHLLSDGLLYAWIVQVPLPGGFFGQQFHDTETENLLGGRVGEYQHGAVLSRFQFQYSVAGERIGIF